MAPVTGRHSVMDNPEPVSLVSPPTSTISAIMAAITNSQSATARPERSRTSRDVVASKVTIGALQDYPTCGPIPKRPTGVRPCGPRDYDPEYKKADRHDPDPHLGHNLCASGHADCSRRAPGRKSGRGAALLRDRGHRLDHPDRLHDPLDEPPTSTLAVSSSALGK